MASLTIRKLDETPEARLRLQAALHGRSMEEEARQILQQALARPAQGEGLGTRVARRFAAAGDVDLPQAPRS